MSSQRNSSLGTGFLLGAVIGIVYAAWSTSKSKGEVKHLVREHLGDIVEHMPEMIDRWIEENWPEEHHVNHVEKMMEHHEEKESRNTGQETGSRKLAFFRKLVGR